MASILAAFFQSGGAKALRPALEALSRGHEMSFAARAAARPALAGLCDNPMTPEQAIEALSGRAPDLLLTDTINLSRDPGGLLCSGLWRAARERGVPSLAFMECWWGYAERFQLPGEAGPMVLPDRIAVVDPLAQGEFLARGFPEEALAVLGSPWLEKLSRMGAARRGELGREFRRECGFGPDDLVLLFVSQPLEKSISRERWGLSEKTVLEDLVCAFGSFAPGIPSNARLAILAHPEEDREALAGHVASLCPPLPWRVLGPCDPIGAALGADLTLGIFSMLLTEAVVLGRPVLSVQTGRAREDMLVTNLVGATRAVLDRGELSEALRGAVCDAGFRGRLTRNYGLLEVAGGSLERWMGEVARMASGRVLP